MISTINGETVDYNDFINTIDGKPPMPRIVIDDTLSYQFDDWSGGFDAAVWAETLLAGATRAINDDIDRGNQHISYIVAGAARATVYTQDRWQRMPEGGFETIDGALHGLVAEWEMQAVAWDFFDDNEFFIGFSGVNNPDRTTNDIIGFIRNAGVIEAICDDGGVETTVAFPASIDAEDWHHYKIVVLDGLALFFIDHTYGIGIATNVSSIASYWAMNVEI